MINKLMRETGEGGSNVIYSNDIMTDEGMFTDIYLKLFSTKTPFWGNDIFDLNFDSKTEYALRNNSLDSKGKENIKRAVQEDLSRIGYADFTVTLMNVNDKLEIKINAKNNHTLQLVWDFTANQNLDIQIQDTETGEPILTKLGIELLTKEGQKITAK